MYVWNLILLIINSALIMTLEAAFSGLGAPSSLKSEGVVGAMKARSRSASSRSMLSDSTVLARLQSDILSSLGMTNPPNPSAAQAIPEYARQLALQQVNLPIDSSDSSVAPEEETHFMAESSNLLLIAKKVDSVVYGEMIQFIVNAEDRSTRMSEIKLYYHINSGNITMNEGREGEKMSLRLNLLTPDADGGLSKHVIQHIEINRHLVGWHSQLIPSNLIRYVLSEARGIPGNVTLNFQLTCTNCVYNAFPAVVTKENVPFLRMNGRRRLRRNHANHCNGGCCMRELIVDFRALGWDWVLYPSRYTANYCTGSCMHPSSSQRMAMSSNSLVLNAMLSNLRLGSTSSCCIPRSEEYLQIVYTDESGRVRSNRNSIRTIHSCKCS